MSTEYRVQGAVSPCTYALNVHSKTALQMYRVLRRALGSAVYIRPKIRPAANRTAKPSRKERRRSASWISDSVLRASR